jgi:large subunit ribosomal protein L30
MNKELRVTLIKSGIGRPKKHKLTLKTLGLNRLHKTVVLKDTPQVRGMINKVSHLVSVIESA